MAEEKEGFSQVEFEFINSFHDIAMRVNKTAADHGFWKSEETVDGDRNNGEMLMLMVSELCEHFERLRSKEFAAPDKHCPEFSNLEIEMADVVIRAMDYCTTRGYRLSEAIIAKSIFNETREYKHGKNF